MDYSRQTARVLLSEHAATTGLLERLDGILTHYSAGMPDAGDLGLARLLGDLDHALESDVVRHFAFEEEELFGRLADNGDGLLADLLREEHEVILPLAASFASLTRAARTDGLTTSSWPEFLRHGRELIDRLTAHIEKEDMALLPLLDDLLDDETDFDLATRYIESH